MKTQVVVIKEDIDPNKVIVPYGNQGNNKPRNGGFWTSSITDNNKSGWLEFAEKEGFYDDMSNLDVLQVEVSNEAKVLIINTKEDYEQALNKYGMEDSFGHSSNLLDFEKLMLDYDGLSLTEKGLHNAKYSFFGWDCESTVWFNIDHLVNFRPLDIKLTQMS